jgi:hypothetical protein
LTKNKTEAFQAIARFLTSEVLIARVEQNAIFLGRIMEDTTANFAAIGAIYHD